MKQTHHLHTLMLLTAVALLIVSAGLYAYLYLETGVLTERAITARGVVKGEQEDQVEGKDVILLYQTTADSRARLSDFFVPSDDAVVFIKTIESLSAQSGAEVTLSAISNNQPPKAVSGAIGSITTHLIANGSWTAIMRTLTLFEDLPYRSVINHMSLSTSNITNDRKSGTNQWQLSFDLSVSTRKP